MKNGMSKIILKMFTSISHDGAYFHEILRLVFFFVVNLILLLNVLISFKQLLYMGVVLYAPSLALNQGMFYTIKYNKLYFESACQVTSNISSCKLLRPTLEQFLFAKKLRTLYRLNLYYLLIQCMYSGTIIVILLF